jgi:hypothetical protein
MFDRETGIIASVLLIGSPLFWYNGEMPLTYALEGLLTVALAFCCFELLKGEKRWFFVSAVLLGLAAGVRQNLIVMLLPLWLYAIRKHSIKKIFFASVVLGITCLAWFGPMVWLTGGLGKYLAAVQAQFTTWVSHPISIIYQMKVRGSIFAGFMLLSLGLGILPMAYYLGRFFRFPQIVEDVRVRFVLFWSVPLLLFYITVNVFNPGHVLVILPPLFIFLGESIKGFSSDLAEAANTGFLRSVFSYRAVLVTTVALIMLVNLHVFLFQDTQVSYPVFRKSDTRLAELTSLTAQNVYISFAHQTDPKTFWTDTGFRIEPIPIPEGIDTLIVWEEEIARYYQDSGRPLREIDTNGHGTKIYALELVPRDEIRYGYHTWTVGPERK